MTSTNIVQISGFSQIPYRIFILPPSVTTSAATPAAITNDLRRAQAALLRRGELVSEKNGELWTFSRDGVRPAPTPDEGSGLQETSTGTLFASQLLPPTESPPQTASTQTLRNGAAHTHFLSSIRALTDYHFLQLPGYNMLGGWLVAPQAEETGHDDLRSLLPTLQSPSGGRDLFRLFVYLSANGDLHIAPERNASISVLALNPAQAPTEGSPIFLSPSGKQALFLSLAPSTSQTSSILQKIRTTIPVEANLPFVRIRLPSAVETLWPANLCFQRFVSEEPSHFNKIDYFNFKDGLSSAIKLVSDILMYKPAPAPSPAIPPAVAAHVTPSGVYHTPPDGATRTKPNAVTESTPIVTQTNQEEWTAPAQVDNYWPPALPNGHGEDDGFGFGGMEDGFDVGDEDFNFFDDEPSGEFENEETVPEVGPPEEQSNKPTEEIPEPMEEVKQGNVPSPTPFMEKPAVLSPPYSPLRILPSPPPTRRGMIPRIWDHVHLSGDIDNNKYERGGKYWCEDLTEDEISTDSASSSSSDNEDMDLASLNPRKRKREHDGNETESKVGTTSLWGQGLDSDAIVRAIEDHFLSVPGILEDFNRNTKPEKRPDYVTEFAPSAFYAIMDIITDQVCWNAVDLAVVDPGHRELPMAALKSVISNIWGKDALNNPGLKEWTEMTDAIPIPDDDLPHTKTPKMKALKSPYTHTASFSMVPNMEQTQFIYPISPPSFLIHRIINRNSPAPNHTQRLSVSPPALRFWEKFSFSPVSGEKYVRCYVVHPDSDGMSTAVDTFLSELETTWEATGMGKFERGSVGKDGKAGMVPVSIPFMADEDACVAGYQEALINLARGILSLTEKWLQNVLILMVNPFPSQSIVIQLSRAFMSFKSAYQEGADNPSLIPESNLALRILPASLIANKDGIITRGLEFHAFIRTLYDRCSVTTPKQSESVKATTRATKFLTSPATLLATPPPSALDFTDSFPVHHRSLLKDNSSIHLAYSVSADARWITAVWSDDWGQSPSSGPSQASPFERACSRMWHRTTEILKQPKINWKLIVARVGPMPKSEYAVWRALNHNQEKYFPGKISLVLACVELFPSFEVSVSNSGSTMELTSPVAASATPFPMSTALFSQSPPAGVGNSYGTPVATPLAQANESPDPSGGILSTPGGTVNPDPITEFDPEMRWMDSKDEVWAIVLNHRVAVCAAIDSEREILFSLSTGFLWSVKSSSSNLVQVHILHGDKASSEGQNREVLKQLLVQYRGLASLGVVRGVSYGGKPAPWHIVAAERINSLLSACM